jgi:ssDNA thymidine ADP-ribosyltransferase, DarT
MRPPAQPKIYHIVHVDRLNSISTDGSLWSDSVIVQRAPPGTAIGMNAIKQRRLALPITCHSNLRVGECVPFYFCPRSIMLYLIHCANHEELAYRGGQKPIVHLEADLLDTVDWANRNNVRWAFTLSNAGAYYFESRRDLAQLSEIDWDAVMADRWSGNGISRSVKEGKQAEFLLECSFPWTFVERIGVISQATAQQVANVLRQASHRPPVEIRRSWYY